MILINGEAAESIEASDRGLHYGDGVFETIAIRDGKPQLWQPHMERLLVGCNRLGIPVPDIKQLAAECSRLCEDVDSAVLKLIITRGSGGRGYRPPLPAQPNRILLRYPWPDHGAAATGIALRLCQTPVSCNRALAGIKHLNRLDQVMARSEWGDETFHEGVMADSQGYLIEGTMSNLFAVKAGVLLTPDLAECGVAGVMRHQVLALAEQMQLPCEFSRITAEELQQMDEVFVTNSIIGLWPVLRFESVSYGDNPITLRLQGGLRTLLERR